MVLICDDHLGDTIITGNTYLTGNIILESRDFVISYLHIGLHTGDAKYVTNITFHKITERIESFKFWRLLMMNCRYSDISQIPHSKYNTLHDPGLL